MSRSVLITVALLARGLAAQAQGEPPGRLGTVRFETSCAPSTRATFVRGVALLHSFGFPDAVRSFNDVLAA